MADINRLISLNIELEGLLKVLLERDSIHARSLLATKIEDYYARVREYLAEGSPAPEVSAALVDEGNAIAADATHTEVKDQEAQETELVDETDSAAAAIEREEAHAHPTTATTVNDRLIKAFTLNDKFRFRRELFNGDVDDFDQTLDLLAQMPSYDEAREYLCGDLMWDERRPEVADFLAILKENMKP